MIKPIASVVALVSLAACLGAPVMYFAGRVEVDSYQTVFLIASIAWFVAVAVYDRQRQRELRATGDQP